MDDILKKKNLDESRIKARNVLHKIKKQEGTKHVIEFEPDRDVFYKHADPLDEHGVMPLHAKIDGQLIATNIILDPIRRMPPLGDSLTTYVTNQVVSSDDEDSIEESRAPNLRGQFTAKDQKIGTLLGDSLSFIDTGRTLINGAEYLKLVDERNVSNSSLICIPWSNITPDHEFNILQQMLHDTNINTSKNGGNFKNT